MNVPHINLEQALTGHTFIKDFCQLYNWPSNTANKYLLSLGANVFMLLNVF